MRRTQTEFLLQLYAFHLWVVGGAVGDEMPPVFKSVPVTVKTTEHDTVLLPCYLDNIGGSTVRWWKGNTLVADSARARTEEDTEGRRTVVPNIRLFHNNTLQVSDLSWEDSGTYVCQVIRPHPWSPINQQHVIQVLYPPSVKMIPQSGILEATLNQEVTITCIPSGVPKPSVTWKFKGEEIQLLSSRNTLRFTTTKASLAGDYTCVASNGVGDPASASVHLNIVYPPEVHTDSIWVHSSPGMRTVLSCHVKAVPYPKVEWLFEKKRVTVDGGRVSTQRQGDKYMLIIKNVRASDFGYYTCKANNTIGQMEHVIQLSGLANMAQFKSGKATENSYTLKWEVDSYSPIIEYKLLFRESRETRRQGQEGWSRLIIPSDTSSSRSEGAPIQSQSYSLRGLKGGTPYEAVVISRNRFGWSRPSNSFRFTTLPSYQTTVSDSETQSTYEESTVSNTISYFEPGDYSTETEMQDINKSSKNLIVSPTLLLCTLILIIS